MTSRELATKIHEWNKTTYSDGIKPVNESKELKAFCRKIFNLLGIDGKKMNGLSIQHLPFLYEGDLREISFSDIFERISEKDLSPAAYILQIVKDCLAAGFSEEHEIAGLVGRGLRAFAPYLREYDLEAKIPVEIYGTTVRRGNAEEDKNEHTDVFILYKGVKYRVWSYQNTEKGLNKVTSKLRGERGELIEGIYLLCPFDYLDSKDMVDLSGWRLHSNNYIKRIKDALETGKETKYASFLHKKTKDQKSFASKIGLLTV